MIQDAEVVSTSPVPVKKGSAKTYSFPEIIQKLIEGERVSRLEWGSNEEYGYLQAEKLNIHTKGQDHVWWVQLADMQAVDWVTIPKIN